MQTGHVDDRLRQRLTELTLKKKMVLSFCCGWSSTRRKRRRLHKRIRLMTLAEEALRRAKSKVINAQESGSSLHLFRSSHGSNRQ